MQKMKLSTKLLTAFLAVGILPASVIGLLALRKAGNAIEKQSYEKLVAMRDVKKGQIEQFFSERQGDMGVLTETVAVLREEAFAKLKAIQAIKKNQIEAYIEGALLNMESFARSKDVSDLYRKLVEYHVATGTRADGAYDVTTPEYKQIWETFGKSIAQFQHDSGFYDIFMICAAHGHVMYTVAKESDMGANLCHGPLKESGLARLRDKVIACKGRAVVDFEPYAPSNNNPAAFAGAPICDANDKVIGVMAVQLSLDAINKIMQERAGLGKTGETYLVGSDKRMRSDSFLDPQGHSVRASLGGTVEKNGCDTEAVRKAFAGESGEGVITDYNGNPVLSVYSPLKVGGLNWAVLAEIDVTEALCPLDEEGNAYFAKYVEMYGYYDLFLINPDGYCFYTAAKEADYQTNLASGKYKDSNLGGLVRHVLEAKQFSLADFAPYAPSNGEPAAFIAQPVVHDGKVEIVAALQLSLDAVNRVMQERAGMGQTGETYLVGSDKLMRSDSFLDPQGHSVKASFAGTVAKNGCDTEASREALAGGTDAKIITDYNGNPVLSAFTPVQAGDATWALLAEIDKAEAFAARQAIVFMIGVVLTIAIGTTVTVALLITRSITKPINHIIGALGEGSEQVSAASAQVSAASQSLAEGATEQAAGLEETSSSLEEMSSMTKQNA
ncbi:MAG: cache domain-containing protein, partial [Phycisphaerales bacterium]